MKRRISILTRFVYLILFCSQFNIYSQWVQMTNGIGSNTSIHTLGLNGYYLFAGTINQGIFISSNNGNTWILTTLNDKDVYSFTTNSSCIFAGCGYNYGVYLSTNGTDWSQTSLNNQTVWALLSNGSYIFAGTNYNGIYLSTNNGTTWTQTSLNNKDIYSFTINGSNIYAGCWSSQGVYVSTNNGSTWILTALNNKQVHSLSSNGIYVFAGTYLDGVYRSSNNGTNWIQTSLNNISIWTITANGSNIFAGTANGGVYMSSDNGSSWIQKNEGMGNLNVEYLLVANNYIFAGTTGYSVYRRPLSDLININPISYEVPKSLALFQNYPNPFNPTTKIKFALPEVRSQISEVRLAIYDVLGKELVVLVKEKLQPGTYEVEFDGSNYPSSVFYYKLQTESFSQTKRMVFIK